MNLTNQTVMRSCYKPGKILPNARSIAQYFTTFRRRSIDGFLDSTVWKQRRCAVSSVEFNYNQQSRSQITPLHPTYIPTYLPTYLHTCIHTYIHTIPCLNAHMHHTIPKRTHAYKHKCMHACIHTYIRLLRFPLQGFSVTLGELFVTN